MNPVVVVPVTEKLVTLMFSKLMIHVCLRTQGTSRAVRFPSYHSSIATAST